MTFPEPADVSAGIRAWLQSLAKNILMFGAVSSLLGGVAWTIGKPFAKEMFRLWYIEVTADLLDEIGAIRETQSQILTRLERTDERDLLQFNGSPIVFPPTQARAGETIAIGYSLRRRVYCETDIVVNFISGALQRQDTSLSYTIPATLSRRSDEFGFVVIDVRIPDGTPPGFYSYAPRAVPVNCPGYAPVIVPPSPFFEVIE